MRWLLDQGVPRSTAFHLQQAGQEAVHVGDIGMAAASDASILAHAAREKQIVVTLDADFHSLITLSQAAWPSVIRIREEGLKGDAVAKLLLHIMAGFSSDLGSGCVMTYRNQKVRIRKLPLI